VPVIGVALSARNKLLDRLSKMERPKDSTRWRNADDTLALTAAIARTLETGGTMDVPPQGAAMRVRVRPVPADSIRKYGRVQLSVALAQWLAYQLSVWHEIVTFYGYASLGRCGGSCSPLALRAPVRAW